MNKAKDKNNEERLELLPLIDNNPKLAGELLMQRKEANSKEIPPLSEPKSPRNADARVETPTETEAKVKKV